MEDLKATLFRLLKDELDSLALGHTFNNDRISMMREICQLLVYYKYADTNNPDVLKIIKFYEY